MRDPRGGYTSSKPATELNPPPRGPAPGRKRYDCAIATDTVALYVRVTPDQRAKLERIAEKKDRSVAWVVRNLIDRVSES